MLPVHRLKFLPAPAKTVALQRPGFLGRIFPYSFFAGPAADRQPAGRVITCLVFLIGFLTGKRLPADFADVDDNPAFGSPPGPGYRGHGFAFMCAHFARI